jgi:hypothetical protein
VDPRTGLDDVEGRKILPLPGLEFRPLGCPARSQSLYRLRYPSSTRLLNKRDAFRLFQIHSKQLTKLLFDTVRQLAEFHMHQSLV